MDAVEKAQLQTIAYLLPEMIAKEESEAKRIEMQNDLEEINHFLRVSELPDLLRQYGETLASKVK